MTELHKPPELPEEPPEEENDYYEEDEAVLVCEWCEQNFFVDDFHEDECPGQQSFWVKGIAPEDQGLTAVTEAFEVFSAHLRKLLNDGWMLIQADNGHFLVGKKVSG